MVAFTHPALTRIGADCKDGDRGALAEWKENLGTNSKPKSDRIPRLYS
jgi:hypothetical protein